MINIFILTLNTLILPTILGYYIVALLDKDNPFPFVVRMSLGYGLGLGCITQWMLILAFFNIPLSFNAIIIPLSISLVFLIKQNIRKRDSLNPPTPLAEVKLNFYSILMTAYIVLTMAFIFWRALNIPISIWDAFSYNGFVAKVIYFERSLQYLPNMPHYEYPLHVPFLQAWASFCLGEWHDIFFNIFFPVYTLCFLVFLFHFLNQYTNQIWSLFGLTLVVSSNLLVHHASIAYRDITLMYYINVALLILILSYKEKSVGKILLAGLMAGIATSVKLDATGYILVVTLVLMLILWLDESKTIRHKITRFLFFFVPCYSILLLFNIYKLLVVEPKAPKLIGEKLSFDLYSLKFKFGFELIVRSQMVAAKIFENLFMSGNWNIVWLLFLISLVNLRRKSDSFEIKMLLFALICFFGLQAAGYIFTQYYYWIADTNTSLSRHLLCHFPVVAALIVLLNGQGQGRRSS